MSVFSGGQAKNEARRARASAYAKVQAKAEQDRLTMSNSVAVRVGKVRSSIEALDGSEEAKKAIAYDIDLMNRTLPANMLPNDFRDGTFGTVVTKGMAEALVPASDYKSPTSVKDPGELQGPDEDGGAPIPQPDAGLGAGEVPIGPRAPGMKLAGSGANMALVPDMTEDEIGRARHSGREGNKDALRSSMIGGISFVNSSEVHRAGFGSEKAQKEANAVSWLANSFREMGRSIEGVVGENGELEDLYLPENDKMYQRAELDFLTRATENGVSLSDAKAVWEEIAEDRTTFQATGQALFEERGKFMTEGHKYLDKWYSQEMDIEGNLKALTDDQRAAYNLGSNLISDYAAKAGKIDQLDIADGMFIIQGMMADEGALKIRPMNGRVHGVPSEHWPTWAKQFGAIAAAENLMYSPTMDQFITRGGDGIPSIYTREKGEYLIAERAEMDALLAVRKKERKKRLDESAARIRKLNSQSRFGPEPPKSSGSKNKGVVGRGNGPSAGFRSGISGDGPPSLTGLIAEGSEAIGLTGLAKDVGGAVGDFFTTTPQEELDQHNDMLRVYGKDPITMAEFKSKRDGTAQIPSGAPEDSPEPPGSYTKKLFGR